jgi:hypothetical protein
MRIDGNNRHAYLLRVRHVIDNGDIPLAADRHQIDVAFAVGKQGARALAADEGNLHPTGERLDKFLQGILARRARIETAWRNRVAAPNAAFERIAERLCLLCRRRQSDVRNGHTLKDEMIGEALRRRSGFLPRLKSGACSAEVL